jgi:hypothetical protein
MIMTILLGCLFVLKLQNFSLSTNCTKTYAKSMNWFIQSTSVMRLKAFIFRKFPSGKRGKPSENGVKTSFSNRTEGFQAIFSGANTFLS